MCVRGCSGCVRVCVKHSPLSLSLRVTWMYFRDRITISAITISINSPPNTTPYSRPSSTGLVVSMGTGTAGMVTLATPTHSANRKRNCKVCSFSTFRGKCCHGNTLLQPCPQFASTVRLLWDLSGRGRIQRRDTEPLPCLWTLADMFTIKK